MELTDILMLWDRFDRSDASEMEVDYHGVRFSVKRNAGETLTTAVSGERLTTAVPGEAVRADAFADQAENGSRKEIKAPLVGTFYAAPAPDASPYAEPGKAVKKGDVVCIIEAMKLMNEVIAKEDGIVEEILVRDGELVSFEQPLMILKTGAEKC